MGRGLDVDQVLERSNLRNLITGDLLGFSLSPRGLPRMMTVPCIIDEDRDTPLKYSRRMVIVANALPLLADRDTKTGSWNFSLDQDSLLLQMKDGITAETEVIYVGSLQVDIDVAEQEEIAQQLLEDFNCVPTFRPAELPKDFYHEFCKQQLWPLFHYMLPICPDHGDKFESSLWQAYVSANKIFADKVTEVMAPNNDFVWIHDYHLMILPTFLRKRFNRVKLGFFLHMGWLEAVLNLPSTSLKVGKIGEQFKDKRLILGVDDMDIFKGLSLKLQVMEQLL